MYVELQAQLAQVKRELETLTEAIEAMITFDGNLLDCGCGECTECLLYKLVRPPAEPQHDLGER